MFKRAVAIVAIASLTGLVTALPKPATDEPDVRIVGGKEAKEGEFPELVAITFKGRYICGGTLINANSVLTAAHCCMDPKGKDMKIRAGSNNREQGGKMVQVSQAIRHPDYRESAFDNDVCVMKLDTDIPEGNGIRYGKLSTSDSGPGIKTVAGWGLQASPETGALPPIKMRKVQLKYIDRQTCQVSYDKINIKITENMVCAGDKGKDSCNGDSGGPLFNSDTRAIEGIVSFGAKCGDVAAVYARVDNKLDFIGELMNQGSNGQPGKKPGKPGKKPVLTDYPSVQLPTRSINIPSSQPTSSVASQVKQPDQPNQPVGLPVKQPTQPGQPIGLPETQPTRPDQPGLPGLQETQSDEPVCSFESKQPNQSAGPPPSQPVGPSVSQPVNLPVSQPVGLPASQPDQSIQSPLEQPGSSPASAWWTFFSDWLSQFIDPNTVVSPSVGGGLNHIGLHPSSIFGRKLDKQSYFKADN